MNKGLREEILKLHKEGNKTKDICLQLNCCKATVSYHLSSLRRQQRIEKSELINSIKNEMFNSKEEFINKYKDVLSRRQIRLISKNFTFTKVSDKEVKVEKEIVELDSANKKERKIINAEYHRNRRRTIKKSLVSYKGGSCEICGYNKCINALQFHHLNPNEKDFDISKDIKPLDKVKDELDKCILVCSNCHSEIHENIYDTLVDISNNM